MTLNNILVLPGDNIGPEITSEAVKVINQLKQSFNLDVNVAFGVMTITIAVAGIISFAVLPIMNKNKKLS